MHLSNGREVMNQLLNTILHLVESTVLEYELLMEEVVEGFHLLAIRCNIRKQDLSSENQYFVAIKDKVGPHCVDWFTHRCQIEDRLLLWKKALERGVREINEYSFPSIFPVRKYTLISS